MKQDQRINSGELTLSNVKLAPPGLKALFSIIKKENKDTSLPARETRIAGVGRPDMYLLHFDSKIGASKFKDAWIKKQPKNPDSSSIYVRYSKSKKHREWSKPLEKAATAVRKFLFEQKAEFGEVSVFVDWSDAQVKVYQKTDKKTKTKTAESVTAATMNKDTYSIILTSKFAGAQAFL